MRKHCLHPLKNPPSLNSFSPNSSGPMPTRATPLALRSASSLLISDAIHRHTWQPNLRRKNKTTGWSCHRDWSSTLWNTQRGKNTKQAGEAQAAYCNQVEVDREVGREPENITGLPKRCHLIVITSILWGNGRFNICLTQQETQASNGNEAPGEQGFKLKQSSFDQKTINRIETEREAQTVNSRQIFWLTSPVSLFSKFFPTVARSNFAIFFTDVKLATQSEDVQ